MTPDQWAEFVRTFGVAGPLIAVLAYMLRESTTERKEINTRFLTALQTTVEQSNTAQVRAMAELVALTHALSEHQIRSNEEHRRIVEALDRLAESIGRDPPQ